MIFIPIAGCIVLGISCLKWKLATHSILYYMEKNQYKMPSKEETAECTGFVVKKALKL